MTHVGCCGDRLPSTRLLGFDVLTFTYQSAGDFEIQMEKLMVSDNRLSQPTCLLPLTHPASYV